MLDSVCAVCVRLVPLSQLRWIPLTAIDLTPLDWTGTLCTRHEHLSEQEPVHEIIGAVLKLQAVQLTASMSLELAMCSHCYSDLRSHRLPPQSLVNGMWLGNIPAKLRDLSFVEKLCIARCRHNVCVVKVAQRQRKLSGNAIVYSQPVAKFYDILPPHPRELDECLAVLFTGHKPPTTEDFKRTPLLVQRQKVLRALQWLKLNHAEYGDIQISMHNLEQYPDNGPLVSVVYLPSDGKPAPETLSVFDYEDEKGT